MKTLRKMPVKHEFVDQIPDTLEYGKIYISEVYKTSVHLCLCGCPNKVVMPLDDGSRWWQLVKENNDTISFIGSVGNYRFDCKSHYIITKSVANFV